MSTGNESSTANESGSETSPNVVKTSPDSTIPGDRDEVTESLAARQTASVAAAPSDNVIAEDTEFPVGPWNSGSDNTGSKRASLNLNQD